jgi:hypothetical protein
MEEKNKVEQFEEGLIELSNNEEVIFELSYSEDEAARKLIDELDPDPNERKEMEEIMESYAADERSIRWDMLTDSLKEKIGRYGGNTAVVEECVAFHREHGYAKDSALETYADFAINPGEDEDIYWGNYFKFFPDEKVPEGMTTYDYLKEQYELIEKRESAYRSISYLIFRCGLRIIPARYGESLSEEDILVIYRANDFKSFYPEYISAFEEVSTATKERAVEIYKLFYKRQSRYKSIARRLLKITPELKIPDEVKERIQE